MSTFLDTYLADVEAEARDVIAELEAHDRAEKERAATMLPDAPARTSSAYQPWLKSVKGVAARMVASDKGGTR